jgi:3-deoxy-manno-octulosonate cytidylyltransferase (CMP-KDO synthetase)
VSSAVAIIPARFASTRFPGKLLHPLHGSSVLARTLARVRLVRGLDAVMVATDDERIADEARRVGATVVMTSPAHPSGSDRVGEVVRGLDPVPDFVLNLQADEPFFAPRAVERLLDSLRARPDAIWTLAEPITDPQEFLRPSTVKVVPAADGRALYFSRAPVPHDRTHDHAPRLAVAAAGRGAPTDLGAGFARGAPDAQSVLPLRHVGVYGFPRELLRTFLALPPGRLERLEGLEQLRALEHGLTIRILVGAWPDPGVDTPQDAVRSLAKYPTPAAMDRAGLDVTD